MSRQARNVAIPHAKKVGRDLDPRSSGTQAIARALAILNCFVRVKTEMGIIEISKELGLSPSTVHRIVRSLASEGFLQQNEQTDRYHLGRSTIILGQVAERYFGFDLALPVLERLGKSTGESVNLGVREGGFALVMLRVDSPHPLRFDPAPGTLVPLHASAMGKALLSFSPEPEREVAGLGSPPAYTENTLTDPRDLLRELERTRERGYSIDNEESVAGVSCVGAPLLGSDGYARAAIALQAPAVRMPASRRKELAPMLIDAAQRLAEVLTLDRRI